MTWLSRISIVVAATTFVFGSSALAGASKNVVSGARAGDIARLTVAGAVEWNFEALLRETFGRNDACSLNTKLGAPVNFPKYQYGCIPSAKYAIWVFRFAHLGKSLYHVTRRNYTVKGWVANVAPILIEGKLIACNKRATQLLMVYSDEPNDAIQCSANPYIYHY